MPVFTVSYEEAAELMKPSQDPMVNRLQEEAWCDGQGQWLVLVDEGDIDTVSQCHEARLAPLAVQARDWIAQQDIQADMFKG